MFYILKGHKCQVGQLAKVETLKHHESLGQYFYSRIKNLLLIGLATNC